MGLPGGLTIKRAFEDAPELARKHGKVTMVYQDTTTRDSAIVSDVRIAHGRYKCLAQFDAHGNRVDSMGMRPSDVCEKCGLREKLPGSLVCRECGRLVDGVNILASVRQVLTSRDDTRSVTPRVVHAGTNVPFTEPRPSTSDMPQRTTEEPPVVVTSEHIKAIRVAVTSEHIKAIHSVREDIEVLISTLEDIQAEGSPVGPILNSLTAAMDDCTETVQEMLGDDE